jgi:CRP-like cAMP-binding protein
MKEDLEGISLFQDLSTQQLQEVAQFCTTLSLSDGDMLIHESERTDNDLYLLCSGSVEIVSASSRVTSGEVVISRQDKDVFGEVGWLTGSPRTASVRCRGQVQAIRVDGRALAKYLANHRDLGYLLMRHIALTLARRMQGTDTLLKQILWNTTL